MKKKHLLLMVLICTGLLGNIFGIEIFFGVNYIFGSVFVLLIVWLYGLKWGVISALVVQSYTIYLWGHPFAYFSLVLEAYVVARLLKWRVNNIFVADLIYWLSIGIWLVPLQYGLFLDLSFSQIQLIMLKQPTNGIFNALLATIFSLLIIQSALMIPRHHKVVSFKFLLFIVILSIVSLALYTNANLNSHHLINRYEQLSIDDLKEKSKYLLADQNELYQEYLHLADEFLKQYQHNPNKPIEPNVLLASPYRLSQLIPIIAVWQHSSDGIRQLTGSTSSPTPPVPVVCEKKPKLTMDRNSIYFKRSLGEHCYLFSFSTHQFLQMLKKHADLSQLDILILNENQLINSSLNLEKEAELGQLYQHGVKSAFHSQVFHLLPSTPTAKMERWKNSYFIIELPQHELSSYHMVLFSPFTEYIESLQQIFIFSSSIMIALILFSAIISSLISQFMLKSFAALSTISKNIPDRVKQNRTIHWPLSYIEEVRHIIKNFAKVSDTLSIMFYDLEQNQRKLYDEIKIRINKEKELAHAIEQADQANQAKSEFLASMSHELRTPLNAVLGFAQLFQLDNRLNEKQQSNAKQIHDSGSYLLTLVNDLLDLSSIEAGKLKIHQGHFHIQRLLIDCCQISQDMAQKKGVKIHCQLDESSDLELHSDYIRLKQVLVNLVSNAIKYHGNNEPQVWISYIHQGDQLRICVRDNGIGIEPESREKMFESFNRVGAENSYIEGTGIGLFISSKLTRMMGGYIEVESEVGVGSQFDICLPLTESNNAN